MSHTIHIVGSLNMDFVVQVDALPVPGQTVSGRGFAMLPGGKGANQACAVGRLGGTGRMIGRVGRDVFGEALKRSLREAGIDVSHVLATEQEASGVALIPVETGGQNLIVVAAGANAMLTPKDVESALGSAKGGFVLLQLESPIETVGAALAVAAKNSAATILDPAPAAPLEHDLLQRVDILTPNETEALALLGRAGGDVEVADAATLARELLTLGPRTVILKLGDKGAWVETDSISRHFPTHAVNAVDATAAGDTFNGALAVALAEGLPIEMAVPFATAAAALSVTKLGAQSSIPQRAAVDTLIAGMEKA
jgi:ribokinase